MAAGEGDGLEDVESGRQGDGAGHADLAADEDAALERLAEDDGDRRVLEVLGIAALELVLQRLGPAAGGDDVADELERDDAVGPDALLGR